MYSGVQMVGKGFRINTPKTKNNNEKLCFETVSMKNIHESEYILIMIYHRTIELIVLSEALRCIGETTGQAIDNNDLLIFYNTQ